jgi:acetate---CoA ligase (ADP-forming)
VGEQLAALWSARSIAIVGASTRDGTIGRRPVEFLRRYGYRGRILPVHPHATEMLGLPCYPRVTDAPGPVDLAMILVPAAAVPAAVEDCVAAGVPVAIVCSSGFAETGAEGAAAQRDLVARARAGGMRLLGPNTIGVLSIPNAMVASFSPLFAGGDTVLVAGPLGFVTQSGALGFGATSLAYERGLGLNWVVSTGNEADASALEVLAALAELPECSGLLGYLEAVTDLPALQRLAATGTPVAVLRAGLSPAGARAAASHTGTLTTADRVVSAVLRRYGVVEVSDVDALLDVGEAFGSAYRPGGPRVGVLTTSGGSGILAADAMGPAGLQLATLAPSTVDILRSVVPPYGAVANPVDVTASVISQPAMFQRCLDAVAGDPGVDIVIACTGVLTAASADYIVSNLDGAARRTGKPVLLARTGALHLAPTANAALRAVGIPVLPSPGRAVRAAAALWRVHRPRPAAPEPAGTPVPAPRDGAGEPELKALLAGAGIPVPRGELVGTAGEAEAVVGALGRAVLKAAVPGLLHKTEAGAVALGVTAATAAAQYRRLAALGGAVYAEEQVGGGVEMLVGIGTGPLGTVVTLGAGGVLAEVLDDVAILPAPVSPDEVRDQLAGLRVARLLAGVRGLPPADTAALVDLVVHIGQLVAGWPPGFELDLNPVTVLPAGQGVRVLDAAYTRGG